MSRSAFLFLAVWMHLASYSQSYEFPEKFNQIYNFRPYDSYEALSPTVRTEKEQTEFQSYVVSNFYQTQFRFDNNSIYMDWPEVEVYLMRLLDSLVPRFPGRPKPQIFLTRSAEANASCSRYGFMYLNVGALANVESEAELATIIAHEAAHYLFKHRVRSEQLYEALFINGSGGEAARKKYHDAQKKEEAQADSFALACLQRMGYSIAPVIERHNMLDMEERVYRYSSTYKGMLKASDMKAVDIKAYKRNIRSSYTDHPLYIERMEQAISASKKCGNCTRNYVIDSTTFDKYKRIAHEECKKILFEHANYEECLRLCFLDYLIRPKSVKNLYLLVECIRRIVYVDPEMSKLGFLHEYTYDVLKNDFNNDILYKPDKIFNDYKQYSSLIQHPLFSVDEKPFKTYRQAFFYFTAEAQKYNVKESVFSMALYYHRLNQKDSARKYLQNYITGGGVNTELASQLLAYGKPAMPPGKLLIVYNNIANYTGFTFNYHLATERKKNNEQVEKVLQIDTAKSRLVFLNTLVGSKPADLYEYQKLENILVSLYKEEDIEVFKKVRLNSRETMDELELSRRQNKNLVLYAPEYYNWMKKRGISKIFDAEVVYQYREYMKMNEYYNNYVGFYVDVNASRPYFKDGIRNGFVQKQTDSEIAKDFHSFLFGSSD